MRLPGHGRLVRSCVKRGAVRVAAFAIVVLAGKADERSAEGQKSAMNVGATLVACSKAAEGVEPRKGAFDDPPVTPKTLAGFNASPGDARDDAAHTTSRTAEDMFVGLVGVQLLRLAAWATARTADARNLVEHRLQHVALVGVGGRQLDGKRHAVAIHHQVLLRTEFSTVRRVRARLLAPPFA